MKFPYNLPDKIFLDEIGAQIRPNPRNRHGLFSKIIWAVYIALLMTNLGPVSPCYADESGIPKVGFLVSKTKQAIEEKSLIMGFQTFFREKSVDPSQYLIVQQYDDSEDSLLSSLANLLKEPNVKILVAPSDLDDSKDVLTAASSSEVLTFVTNPCVRFVSGEICRPNIFRVAPNTYLSSQPLARWALLNIGRKVFITGDDSEPGNELSDFFALGLEKIGGSFGDRIMVPLDSNDFDSVFQKLEESKADFIFAAFSEKTAPKFIKAYTEKNIAEKYPLVGVGSLTAYPEPIKELGKSGLGIRTLCSIKDPIAFGKSIDWKEAGNPDLAMAAQGYYIAGIFYSCLQEKAFEGSSLQKTYEFVSKLTVEGPQGKIQFDANREAILEMEVCHWEHDSNGSLIRVLDEKFDKCHSLDFGCGGVGFPDRPELAQPETGQTLWEEHNQ